MFHDKLVDFTERRIINMKMYTCTKEFKTTIFENSKKPERIKIEVGSDWFLAKKESEDRCVLCNNKIELILSEKILKNYFRQWG